ncbi:Proline-rich receptor-like protein kinase perk4 [Turnera subulata]|uniref:non-specific serine/threonine protein kinase n=1 Tax=Turnera subulata TaxID=218843 RepID=A0A9Q0G1U0_9ROSI|nr:Proline-rich receptor-like protein kinase perk4 [Turnera subulata]
MSENDSAPSPSSDSPPDSTPPSDSALEESPSPPPPEKSTPPPKESPPPPEEKSPPPPEEKSPPSPKNPSTPPSPPPPPHDHKPNSPPHSEDHDSPSSKLSPPPPHKSHSSSKSSNDEGITESQLKLVIGFTVAVGILVLLAVVYCICRNKKKKKRQEYTGYYGNYPQTGEDPYYIKPQNPNWQSEHVMKMQQGQMTGPGWHAQPPPTPPVMGNSGDMTGNYSGPHRPVMPPPSPGMSLGFNKSTFSYDELAAATGGFSQANLLGQGGFGYVHKGVLPNGKEIAVKSLKSGSGQGEREFQAEVEIISRVHHRHLVSLVGYCIADGQRMLVYEFVPNNTLEHHLHGKHLPVMDWSTRLRIALGSAKGLAYLHEDCHPRIIHRDIKAANILLDYNFEAMVADFGLAKLSSDNYTHVSTRVMGTFGYLAPEYAASGKLTEKSDVFSFGVMLLELITGKRPVDPSSIMDDSLVDWARPLLTQALEQGIYAELADIRLDNNFNTEEMRRMVACAAASIRHSAKKRPKMSQIVRALEGDVSLEDLNEGTKPGQSAYFGGGGSTTSEYDASSYNSDLKRFRQLALSSQEFSSELGTSSGDSREMQKRLP